MVALDKMTGQDALDQQGAERRGRLCVADRRRRAGRPNGHDAHRRGRRRRSRVGRQADVAVSGASPTARPTSRRRSSPTTRCSTPRPTAPAARCSGCAPKAERCRAQEIYFTREMQNHHGGVVLVNGYLYGFNNSILTCLDFATGKMMWRHRSVGKGPSTYADGHLYILSEDNVVGLAEASPAGYREKGRFEIRRPGLAELGASGRERRPAVHPQSGHADELRRSGDVLKIGFTTMLIAGCPASVGLCMRGHDMASHRVVHRRRGVWGLSPATTLRRATADWTQWRGPNRDGAVAVVHGAGALARAADAAMEGRGRPRLRHAARRRQPRLHVLAAGRQRGDERARRATAARCCGRPAIRRRSRCTAPPRRMAPDRNRRRCSSNGRLYSIGMTGVVTAFDAATGKQLWQKPAPRPCRLYTSHAFSPLVDGGPVIFHVGGHDKGALTAFDAITGDVKWSWNGDGPGYGSPIVVDVRRHPPARHDHAGEDRRRRSPRPARCCGSARL